MQPNSRNDKKLPRWVPKAAQQKLRELMSSPSLKSNQRLVLDRFATRTEMKTDVWGKLPREQAGKEGLIIEWAWYAVVSFSTDLSPSERKSFTYSDVKNWDLLAREHPVFTTPRFLVNLVALMLHYMKDWAALASTRFQPVTSGVKSYDEAIDVITDVGIFFAQLEIERQKFLQQLPAAGSRYSKKAHRAFFTRVMSQFFTESYGKPLDAVVSGLEQVAFDLLEGAGEAAVRDRRRTAKKRPKKIRPKGP